MNNRKLPILAHGELYIESAKRKSGPIDKKYPRDYGMARERLLSDLQLLERDIREDKKFFMDEKVICIRLEPKFEAKSYCPDVITNVSDEMKIIGGRRYNYDESSKCKAKLYYVRTSDTGLTELRNTLEQGYKENQKNWVHQIQSLNTIDVLQPEERRMGFDINWEKGPVEFILHPMGDNHTQEMVTRFFELSELKKENASIRTYKDGITFISTIAKKNNINAVSRFNPLRSVHPMNDIELDILRGSAVNGPMPPKGNVLSDIVIGAFDSGIDEKNAYFKGFAKNIDMVSNEKRDYSHGSGVVGTLLYGLIENTSSNSTIETPKFSVQMFRVFPEDGKYSRNQLKKVGLYETIDKIEQVVKKHKNIRLYNLSIGPSTPILDDEISRFTYALDELSYAVEEGEHNPLFSIAIGNNGDKGAELDRIQPPSDMVNGLAVGAYTYNSIGDLIRAHYSCLGPGREGAKVKPDILEFGGSENHPFVSVSKKSGNLQMYMGTSFAAPLAMHKIGRLLAESKSISPHMGRTLLIHCAQQGKKEVRNIESGYGYSVMSPDEMLHCDDHKVTILYEGSLAPGITAKLPMFAPFINQTKGNVTIKWTITTIVSPETNDSDAYTNNCIEDTFYPHSQKFTFKKGKHKKPLDLSIPENIIKQSDLLNQGYTQSSMPDSKPGKIFKDESELRNTDLKWDTVIKKSRNMKGTSLSNPFITIHAMARNGFDNKPIKYFIAITIEAPRYKGSLYDNIIHTYNRLEPIKIRNIGHPRIKK